MSDIVVKPLSKLNNVELDSLVALSLRAFASDASMDDLVGGDSSLKDLYFRSILGAANVGTGQIYGAVEGGTGNIVSFAVWAPPGKVLIETPEEREQGYNEFVSRLSLQAKEWRAKIFMALLDSFFKEILQPKSVRDSWSISLVATDPNYQRRGLATRVIQTMLREHRGSGDLSVISCGSEHLERFYQAQGFQTKGYKVVPGCVNPEFPVYVLAQWL